VGINVHMASAQANKLEGYASQLHEIKAKLLSVKANLNHGWQAQEMIFINQSIEKIENEISKAMSMLNSVAPDIVSVAYQIKREEEAREAAAKAAALRNQGPRLQ